MLKLILGRTGSGKTTEIENYIEKKLQQKKQFLIVPEQATYLTEKRMLERFGPKSALSIEVCSFSRLPALVFAKHGGNAGNYVDDVGRTVLMNRALLETADHLEVYGNRLQTSSFAAAMLKESAAFKANAISPQMLAEAGTHLHDIVLQKKVREISLILSAYEALMSVRFLDSLDDLTRLAGKLDVFPFFEKSSVYIDNFKGFTQQEMLVIKKIMTQADEVVLSLPCDSLHDNEDFLGIFSNVKATAQALIAGAARLQIPVAPPRILTTCIRYLNPSLAYLERHGFSGHAAPFEEAVHNLKITRCKNRFDEVEAAACTINRLVREEGFRYSDIAVIVRDLSPYQEMFRTVFESYGIQYYLNKRFPISGKPLILYLSSAIDILLKGWKREDVLRHLKTGLSPLTREEVFLLENYLYLWDLNGSGIHKPYSQHPRGYVNESTEEDRMNLDLLNHIRSRFTAPLLRLGDTLREKQTGRDFCSALYSFLETQNVPDKIQEIIESLEYDPAFSVRREYEDVWNTFMKILDQIASATEDFVLTAKKFSSFFSLAVSMADLGSLPPSFDQVNIGTADRIRAGNTRAVLILGMNEGLFPKIIQEESLFTDAERQALSEAGLDLPPGGIYQTVEELFLAYSALCAAKERVFISFAGQEETGAPLRPSHLILDLLTLFPRLSLTDSQSEDPQHQVVNLTSGFRQIARNLHAPDPFIASLKYAYQQMPDYQKKLARVEQAAGRKPEMIVNKQLAEQLFGRELRLSATKLETFQKCRFSYFCQYGLQARPKEKARLEAPEIGTLIHYVMENLLKSVAEKGISSYTKPELHDMIHTFLESYATIYMGGLENKPKRFQYLYHRLFLLLQPLINHILDETAHSDFLPVDFELSVRKGGDVEPLVVFDRQGRSIIVEGFVDRVDIMKKNGRSYLRIVDYKTGKKEFSLNDLLYGVNMQMLIYLFAIWNNGGGKYGDIIPSGVLYAPVIQPSVPVTQKDDESAILNKLRKVYQMKGLLLCDSEAIRGMEHEGNGVFIPAKIKKDGSLDSRFLVTLEQFGQLNRYIQSILRRLSSCLYNGEIAAVPLKGKALDACTYCRYHAACGFEDTLDPVVTVEANQDAQIWDIVAAKTRDGKFPDHCNMGE